MFIKIFEDKFLLAKAAADRAVAALQQALNERDHARIIAATGASQFEFLDALTAHHDVDWPNVEMFHLDEYIGLSAGHPASFRKYLRERLIEKTGITQFHFLAVDSDPEGVAEQVGMELNIAPIDIAFVGIGENGHLAFNDPPADFDTEKPYLIVELDEACRRQQAGEGWFADITQVPTRAVSMSIRKILKSKEILVVVPDARKAEAVKACLEGNITPLMPASILQRHPNVTVYLDRDSSALLSR